MRRGRLPGFVALGVLVAAVTAGQAVVAPTRAEAALGLAVPSDMGAVSGQPGALVSHLAENGRAIGQSGTQAATWKNGRITDLGSGTLAAVNDVDQIVGRSGSSATLWQPDGGKVTLLDVPFSTGAAINNRGEVLIRVRPDSPDARIGIWRPAAGYTELLPPGHTPATMAGVAVNGAGINASGQVAMAVTAQSGAAFAARCDATGCARLPNPAGMRVNRVVVYGINGSGQIAGTITVLSADGATAKDIAVTWKGAEVVVLGDPTSPGSTVARTSDPINERGDVIGSQAGQDNVTRATLWRDGTAISLAPGLRDATATAINDNGDVVGTGTGTFGSRGFRWQNGQTVELPPVPVLTLSLTRTVWVTGITNAGMIAGWTTALNVEGAPIQGAVNRATTWTVY